MKERTKEEIYRLKVKCNSYAERLVREGFDDIEWEVTYSSPELIIKTRAREIAEEVSSSIRCGDFDTYKSIADHVESAILRREKELEEGR